MGFQGHFSGHAAGYARARPRYPDALFEALAGLAPARTRAWDAGSGNGLAAVALAALFDVVDASEPSAAQLAEAAGHPRVRYHQSAETAPFLAAGSVDLLTVAQAAQW